jgi:multidrug resistance efflux pump
VLVTDVVKRDVPVYGEWVGTLAGFINAEIRAKVQGYLLKTTYQEGALVKEGDVLFELDPRQYQAAVEKAKADVAQTQAVLVRSQQNVDRYRPLVARAPSARRSWTTGCRLRRRIAPTSMRLARPSTTRSSSSTGRPSVRPSPGSRASRRRRSAT